MGAYRVDEAARLVYAAGKEIRLTPEQWRVFCYLRTQCHRYCSSQELWEELWGTNVLYPHVRYMMWQLRGRGIEIENRRGFGWRLIANEIFEGADSPAAVSHAAAHLRLDSDRGLQPAVSLSSDA